MMLTAILAAAAQAMPYALIPNASDMEPHELRLRYRAYGECVIQKRVGRAVEAILSNLDDEALIVRHGILFDGNCWPVSLGTAVFVNLQADRVRSALAEALVRKQLAAQPAPVLVSVPPLTHVSAGPLPTVKAVPAGSVRDAKDQVALGKYQDRSKLALLSRFGECVVRGNPNGAKVLLLTDPDSVQESSAFARLGAALNNCLMVGESLDFTKEVLRGTIAVNYFRLAIASQNVSAAGAPK